MSPNPLRSIPSVNELLENPVLKGLVDRISHNTVVNSVRTVLDEVRQELQTSAAEHTLPSVSELADRIARRVLETDERSLRPVINATGIVLHSWLGRTILAESAVAAMAAAAGDYASVELDLVSGKHRRRNHAVEGLLKELTGAEAAIVLNNNAGATLAALAALAAGREVVVSRGHLIEIGCSYRLAETVAASGAVLREIGSVNRTTIGDYADAIGERTAALLLVQPGNFTLAGSTGGVAPAEVIDLAHRKKVPLIHDLGAGALVDFSQFGLIEEPLVPRCVAAGADVVLFSGDKLIGGPQSGIVVGRRDLVAKIEKHPLARALRVNSPTLAALVATLRLYREPEKALREIPLLALLGTSLENLQNRAARLAPQIEAASVVRKTEVLDDAAYLAGDAVPSRRLATASIAVEPEGLSADRLAGLLRAGKTPVVAAVREDRLVIDLRSVLPRQDIQLVEAFEAISAKTEDSPQAI